MSIAPFIRALI